MLETHDILLISKYTFAVKRTLCMRMYIYFPVHPGPENMIMHGHGFCKWIMIQNSILMTSDIRTHPPEVTNY